MEERGHLGIPGASVHRHILERMNTINDYFIKKKATNTPRGGGEDTDGSLGL